MPPKGLVSGAIPQLFWGPEGQCPRTGSLGTELPPGPSHPAESERFYPFLREPPSHPMAPRSAQGTDLGARLFAARPARPPPRRGATRRDLPLRTRVLASSSVHGTAVCRLAVAPRAVCSPASGGAASTRRGFLGSCCVFTVVTTRHVAVASPRRVGLSLCWLHALAVVLVSNDSLTSFGKH